jgi:tetratricopeptide (TPR) repeat protein
MRSACLALAAVVLMAPSLCLAADTSRDQMVREEARLEDKGDFQGAIDQARKILAAHPRDLQTINAIAGLYGKMGRFADEITWAKKAISIDGSYFLAYINMGNAMFYLKRSAEARAAFEKAKALAPLDPLPIYSLGTMAEAERKSAEAIACFEASVALDPTFESGLFSLAAMYANVRRFDDAIATIDRLLRLNPDAQDAVQMRAQIEAEMARTK